MGGSRGMISPQQTEVLQPSIWRSSHKRKIRVSCLCTETVVAVTQLLERCVTHGAAGTEGETPHPAAGEQAALPPALPPK